jgi:hypothetical protein
MVVRRMLEKEMIAKNVICETIAICVYFTDDDVSFYRL